MKASRVTTFLIVLGILFLSTNVRCELMLVLDTRGGTRYARLPWAIIVAPRWGALVRSQPWHSLQRILRGSRSSWRQDAAAPFFPLIFH